MTRTYERNEYGIWSGMKARCFNPNTPSWHRYGGRGITVCERWRTSFDNFLADMGPRPSPKHSIDRINNDGNYEPGNCRWATPAQQAANNSMVTYFMTVGGRTQSVRQWAIEVGIPYEIVFNRWACGVAPDLCLSMPVGTRWTGTIKPNHGYTLVVDTRPGRLDRYLYL